jgi:hypothetical protein
MLILQPITLKEAMRFIEEHHRHHKPPQGGKFAIAVNDGNHIVGVAIAGRPVARMLDDGWTLEITRLCTIDGARNAASMLYRACWRAARAMGYKRVITYVLASEKGISLKASGFKEIGMAGGGSWNRATRFRVDTHPTEQKKLFEAIY